MSKRYYCDYCDKTMVSTPSMIKTHNRGLVHQKLVQEHYQQYKDPETILQEEQDKKPCSRFMNGNCQFGSICRFSHYTPEQIHALRLQVEASKIKHLQQPEMGDVYKKLQEYELKSKEFASSIIFLNNGESQVLPWTYNSAFDQFELPPSLRRLNIEAFKDVSLCDWG